MPEMQEPAVLLEQAHDAVQMALDAGAKEAWATSSSVRSIECRMLDGQLEQLEHSQSRGLSLEIFIDGRHSQHSTSDLRPRSIREFMRDAVALTRAMEPDPHRALPNPALYEGRADVDLELHDPSIVALTNDDRIALAGSIDARLAGAPDVLTRTTQAVDHLVSRASASSNGFSGSERRSVAGGIASVTMKGAGDRRPRGGMGLGTTYLADLPAAEWIADESLRRGRARLGSRKGPTVTTNLVVDRLATQLLISDLLRPTHGRSLQQGRSLWADKEGKPAVSEVLTITDEPLLPRSSGARLFDGEGIASRPMTVIERGTLRNFFIDCYYGRKLGRPPTTAGWSNLVVKPGRGDAAALAREVGEGIYVTSWLGGNSDPTSGEFSRGLSGHLIEKGEIGAPVDEMNITGNLLQLFSSLVQVGDDPWIYSTTRCPTLVFENVSFSGA